MSDLTRRPGNTVGGRPSKGERYAAKTRLPIAVAEAVWEIHDRTGTPISDVIANFVALGVGLPEHAPVIADPQELPLKTA